MSTVGSYDRGANGPDVVSAAAFDGVSTSAWDRDFADPDRLTPWWRRSKVLALLDQMIVSLTNFTSNMFVAWSSTSGEFGIYGKAMALLHFAKGFQEQLVASPYSVYAQRKDREDAAAYTGSSLVHQTLGAAGFTALIGMIWFFAPRGPESTSLVLSLQVLLPVVPVFLIREHLRRLSFAHFRFGTALLMDQGMGALQLTGLALLYATGQLTVPRAYALIVISSLAGIALWFSRRTVPLAFDTKRCWSDWASNWQFGRWALATFLIGCTTPYFMPWLVAFKKSDSEAGRYVACATLVGLANMLIVGAGNILSPWTARVFTESGPAALWRVLQGATLFFIMVLGTFAAIMALAGDPLATWILGKEYTGLGPSLAVLALAQMISATGVVAGNGLCALDRPKSNLGADGTTLIATLVAAFAWIPNGNLLGATLAVLTGAVLGTVVRWESLRRQLQRQYRVHEDSSQVHPAFGIDRSRMPITGD